jgi:hypothetical protein
MQLRFHVGSASKTAEEQLSNLATIEVGNLSRDQRAPLAPYLDDGCDLWATEWTHTALNPDTGRIERTYLSGLTRSRKRISVPSASWEALLEAVKQHTQELQTTPSQSRREVHPSGIRNAAGPLIAA